MAITHLLTRSNPNRHEVIKVVQSEMLQVLQELNKCDLRLYTAMQERFEQQMEILDLHFHFF